MRKLGLWILSGVLAVGLAISGFWGYREYISRQELQNRAESQYQKNFHELALHVDLITGQLAQLLVTSSREQNLISLATLWRQTFAAQANLGGLPLTLVPLSKTEKLLSDTGDITYALFSRTAQGAEGLQEKDLKIVQQLYDRSKVLREELAKVGAKILNDDESWTQVETVAIQTNGELADNTILDGFELMEQKMEAYPELNVGEDFAREMPDVKKVESDKQITAEKAEEIARRWWFLPDDQHQVKISYEGLGDVPTYGMEFSPLKNGESPVYIDVSKLDGTVIWAMTPKNIEGAQIDLSQGERLSKAFLEKRGFGEMVLIKVEQEDATGVYTFVPLQEDVLLYPDQVKVQIALDNGDVIGYEGTPYYMFHKWRNMTQARISEARLRKQVSPYLQVELIRPALIADTWGKEILTWEVRGGLDQEKFVIFYNAQTGSEEQITRITPPPKFEFNVEG